MMESSTDAIGSPKSEGANGGVRVGAKNPKFRASSFQICQVTHPPNG